MSLSLNTQQKFAVDGMMEDNLSLSQMKATLGLHHRAFAIEKYLQAKPNYISSELVGLDTDDLILTRGQK